MSIERQSVPKRNVCWRCELLIKCRLNIV